LLGLDGQSEEVQHKRAHTEIRLVSGWGSEGIITWKLERGSQVTGQFKSSEWVHKLVRGISQWQPTSSPGREVAAVSVPVSLVRPRAHYAVRTPSKESASGSYHAVVFTSRTNLPMTQVVEHDDRRVGMEADLKGGKHGLGLAIMRKQG
jgi:hypothetical protein